MCSLVLHALSCDTISSDPCNLYHIVFTAIVLPHSKALLYWAGQLKLSVDLFRLVAGIQGC